MPDIKFLFFKGCPHAKEALGLLKEVCLEKNIPESNINIVEIKNEIDAVQYKFLGSPSIQINDTDIEISRINDEPLFGCRIYKDNQGVPSREMIKNALEAALNSGTSVIES